MPPKRKTGGGGGRGKRPKQSSADVENSEEQMQTRQKTDDKDAPPMLPMTEEGSSKLLKTLPIGEADADGEADDGRVDATHDKDAKGEKEELGKANTEEQQQQGASDERGEGDGDQLSNHEADIAKPAPPTSTRGRGRGRPRRARGAASGLTRGSLRKTPQETQGQLTSEPFNTRGRKAARGRGRGVVAFNPSRIELPPTEGTTTGVGAKEGAVTEGKERKDEEDEEIEGEGEGEAGAVSHQSLPQPPPLGQSQEVQRIEHSPQEPSHQIHGVGQSGHAPAGPFPPHHPAYYPSYPPQAGSFPYPYGAPPPPAEVSSAPDVRSYPALHSDEAQTMYTTSFATTVRTGNEPNSASSSFNTPYPSSALPAHPLDAIAPQGNPYPPTAPTMPVSAYGPAVYKVVSDDDDDRNQSENSGSSVHVTSPKKKAASAAKGVGRTGRRGHHLACHFCRGRKLKCDGRRPTCGHCALRNQACAFDASLRRRGPGRKKKNNQGDQNATSSKRTEGAISDLSAGPQTSTQSHSQMSTFSTEGVKGKRHHSHHTNGQSQTNDLRIEEADGTGVAVPATKPATAAYGIENNERLGFYYAGGGPGQFCAPYPPYGDYNQAASAHPPPQQAAYAYAQGGGEDDADENADMNADGEGGVYGSRPPEGGSYGQPLNGSHSHAWPAEPPGGVPVSHPRHM